MNKLLSTVGSGILAKVVVDEFKAWNPRLTSLLVARAVQRLPREERERYEEEWKASLREVPGDLSKIIYALSLLRAGTQMRLMMVRGPQWATLNQAVVSAAERFCGLFLIVFFAPLLVFTVASVLLLAAIRKERVLLPPDEREWKGNLRALLRLRTDGLNIKLTDERASVSGRLQLLLVRMTVELIPDLFQVANGKLRLGEWTFIKAIKAIRNR